VERRPDGESTGRRVCPVDTSAGNRVRGVLGCDVGGTSIKWVVLEGSRVLAQGERPTPSTGASDVVEALAEICHEAEPFETVGIGVPAVVNSVRGELLTAPNLAGDWSGYEFVREVEKRAEKPVTLANDARCFALAEWRLGSALAKQDALFVTLGTGVGGAVVAGGQLQMGHDGHAGELGHIVVEPFGPRCGCGAHGCLETYASGPAITAAAIHGVLRGSATSILKAAEGKVGGISPPVIVSAARAGDVLALEVLERAAWALGRALALATSLLEPEVVVIGGGLSECVDLLAPRVEAAVAEYLHLYPPPTIVPAALGRKGGAMGAALWADCFKPNKPQRRSRMSTRGPVSYQDSARPLPAWASRLMARHPGAQVPSPGAQLPGWLEEELSRVPLWYHIRGADGDPRWAAPFHLIEDVEREPALLEETLNRRPEVRRVADALISSGVEHVIFTGCGSAWYTSVLAAFVLPRLTGLSAEAVESSEFVGYQERPSRPTALVLQSATGSSFETLDAAASGAELGMATVAITNTYGSLLENHVQHSITFPTGQQAGPDISVIPTRLMLLYLLIFEITRRRPHPDRATAPLERELATIPAIAQGLVSTHEEVFAPIAKHYAQQQAMLVVGGGPNWFAALEAALKIEEESSTPCRAYTPGDYHHMAISLLGPSRTTLVFAPHGPSAERALACLRTAREGGSPAIAVLQDERTDGPTLTDEVVRVPGVVDELLFAPLATMVGQILGYHLGLAKGLNPDCLGTDEIGHARAWLASFPFGTH
jgi:predicted NBD/HSP70 family sugar kinase/fructoselysine-6-P-deglycase FrlB-like protein